MEYVLSTILSVIILSMFLWGGLLTLRFIENKAYEFNSELCRFLLTLPTIVDRTSIRFVVIIMWPYFWILFLLDFLIT